MATFCISSSYITRTPTFPLFTSSPPILRRTWESLSTMEPKKKQPLLWKIQSNSHKERLAIRVRSSGISSTPSSNSPINVGRSVHLLVSLGLLLGIDNALKRGFVGAGIKFPSALFGMFCIFTLLMVLDYLSPPAAQGFLGFFEPATTFIQRWLPLFYVPSLVVLPLAVKGIPAASGAKIFAILVGGWAASLCVAGYTAISVRRIVKTEMIAAEPMPNPSSFSTKEIVFWAVVFSASFVLAVVSPMAFGTSAKTCIPFLLAATALGYIVGTGFSPTAKKFLHPIITCALAADLAVFAYGVTTGNGFESSLDVYLTKSASNPGAGDILMGFLGSVILSFAFSMFRQRKLVKRHAIEIFSAVVLSTTFSLYSTAILGRMVGLEPALTTSILPRCITVALALSIVSLFEGTNPSLTAAVVVLTGLVGANFAQTVLDKLGLDDPIARGMATASRRELLFRFNYNVFQCYKYIERIRRGIYRRGLLRSSEGVRSCLLERRLMLTMLTCLMTSVDLCLFSLLTCISLTIAPLGIYYAFPGSC